MKAAVLLVALFFIVPSKPDPTPLPPPPPLCNPYVCDEECRSIDFQFGSCCGDDCLCYDRENIIRCF